MSQLEQRLPKFHTVVVVSRAGGADAIRDRVTAELESGAARFRRGDASPINVHLEIRQGKKKVTRVDNVESYGVDAKTVARLLQRRFACSATTQDPPGAKNAARRSAEIVVQGDLTRDIVTVLCDEFGLPRSLVVVHGTGAAAGGAGKKGGK